MLKTTFEIIFENIFVHLQHYNCQNIGTPPLLSYRATHTLTSDTMVPSRRVGVALWESRGCPIGGQGWAPLILPLILVKCRIFF